MHPYCFKLFSFNQRLKSYCQFFNCSITDVESIQYDFDCCYVFADTDGFIKIGHKVYDHFLFVIGKIAIATAFERKLLESRREVMAGKVLFEVLEIIRSEKFT